MWKKKNKKPQNTQNPSGRKKKKEKCYYTQPEQQKNIVEVIKLIAKDTIEEKIIDLQEDKREIINSIMDDESLNINNISRLTNDEILNLFK